MDAAALQQYIEQHIPVVARNGLVIRDCTNHLVTVAGQLDEHLNHVGTAFGGSISMALTVAAWAHVRSLMDPVAAESAIVVRRQTVEFHRPVTRDFLAVTKAHPDGALVTFQSHYAQHGKARLTVQAELFEQNGTQEDDRVQALASYEGVFVILKKEAFRNDH